MSPDPVSPAKPKQLPVSEIKCLFSGQRLSDLDGSHFAQASASAWSSARGPHISVRLEVNGGSLSSYLGPNCARALAADLIRAAVAVEQAETLAERTS